MQAVWWFYLCWGAKIVIIFMEFQFHQHLWPAIFYEACWNDCLHVKFHIERFKHVETYSLKTVMQLFYIDFFRDLRKNLFNDSKMFVFIFNWINLQLSLRTLKSRYSFSIIRVAKTIEFVNQNKAKQTISNWNWMQVRTNKQTDQMIKSTVSQRDNLYFFVDVFSFVCSYFFNLILII